MRQMQPIMNMSRILKCEVCQHHWIVEPKDLRKSWEGTKGYWLKCKECGKDSLLWRTGS